MSEDKRNGLLRSAFRSATAVEFTRNEESTLHSSRDGTNAAAHVPLSQLLERTESITMPKKFAWLDWESIGLV